MSDDDNFTPKSINEVGELISFCRKYLQYLKSLNRARNTLIAYRTDLEQFCGYSIMRGNRFIQTISTSLVQDWIVALVEANNCSHRTAARKFETVKGLMKYAVGRGLISTDPCTGIASINYNSEPVIAPDENQISRLLKEIPRDNPLGIRDRAIFQLMFDAALRNQAIIDLNLNRTDGETIIGVDLVNLIVRFRCKGGRIEEVGIERSTADRISAWLKIRHRFEKTHSPNALFLGIQGNRLSRTVLLQRLRIHGNRIGIDHITPHMLRHRRIGEVALNCGLQAAQKRATHKSATTTIQVYGHHESARQFDLIRTECPINLD